MKLFALLCMVISLLASRPAKADETWNRNEIMVRVERAYWERDGDQLEKLRAELEARSLGSSPAATDSHYDLAYLLWRKQLTMIDDSKQIGVRKQLLTAANEHIDELLLARPEDIEASVLLSCILAGHADMGSFARMRYGPRAYTLANENIERSPNQPRALLQLGILLFHTPPLFGGGPEAALEHLERAHAQYSAQSSSAAWPSWGFTDASAWLGQALVAVGRTPEARVIYEQALANNPNAGWISEVLLPALPEAQR